MNDQVGSPKTGYLGVRRYMSVSVVCFIRNAVFDGTLVKSDMFYPVAEFYDKIEALFFNSCNLSFS